MAPNKNYMLNDKFPKHIKNATSTSDGLMSSEDKAKFDELFEFGLLSLVTQETDGIMMHQDKKKLDGIEEGANNYIHPDTHPATMIVEDSSHRFTTDTEKVTWNAKASKAVVTTTVNGLMSAEDKTKLDGIDTGANKYIHPDTHPSTMIIEDSTHRFVTDEEKANWNSKPSTAVATTSSSGLMSADDKKKLDNIEDGANNYVHPSTHEATMIIEDSTHRFVTDKQIATWNAKASTAVATQTDSGLMSSSDKTKLDGIESGANKYVHPSTHAATMITEDSTHRFVTDEQIATWNAKASTDVATQSANGLMSSSDKTKLDGIESGANKYVHPTTHSPSIIDQDENNRFVTDTEKAAWNAKASTAIVSTTANGLMIATDKVKLDGIESEANKYVHPTTHSPSIIDQDENNRFVTDDQITAWTSKASTAVVTTTVNGLMIATDKVKLDGIESEANKYVHPTTHSPSIIDQDENNRFVTDKQITAWTSKASTAVVTTTANGLMIATDKVKLDGIESEANKYVHPTTHSPSIIDQDENNRFVTDTEKAAWNAKASTEVATSTSNGLMSKEDKKKLDGLDEGGTIPANIDATIITQDDTHKFVTDKQIATWNAKASTDVATQSANGLMSAADKKILDDLVITVTNISEKIKTAIYYGDYGEGGESK